MRMGAGEAAGHSREISPRTRKVDRRRNYSRRDHFFAGHFPEVDRAISTWLKAQRQDLVNRLPDASRLLSPFKQS